MATQAVSVPRDPFLEAFESQHEVVTADPGDFDKWVKLIGAAETLVRCPDSSRFPLFRLLSMSQDAHCCVPLLILSGCVLYR